MCLGIPGVYLSVVMKATIKTHKTYTISPNEWKPSTANVTTHPHVKSYLHNTAGGGNRESFYNGHILSKSLQNHRWTLLSFLVVFFLLSPAFSASRTIRCNWFVSLRSLGNSCVFRCILLLCALVFIANVVVVVFVALLLLLLLILYRIVAVLVVVAIYCYFHRSLKVATNIFFSSPSHDYTEQLTKANTGNSLRCTLKR